MKKTALMLLAAFVLFVVTSVVINASTKVSNNSSVSYSIADNGTNSLQDDPKKDCPKKDCTKADCPKKDCTKTDCKETGKCCDAAKMKNCEAGKTEHKECKDKEMKKDCPSK